VRILGANNEDEEVSVVQGFDEEMVQQPNTNVLHNDRRGLQKSRKLVDISYLMANFSDLVNSMNDLVTKMDNEGLPHTYY
jgi:hypothetical protein